MESKRLIQAASFVAVAASVMFAADAVQAAAPAPLKVKPGGTGDFYPTIQAAIDAASSGGVVNVYPGDYVETAVHREVLDNGGDYTFGLYIGSSKAGLTVQGVDAKGHVIHDSSKVLAHVVTLSDADFGPDGVFVEGDHVTISGLDIGSNYDPTTGDPSPNKTIEVIGDDFALLDCVISEQYGGSVYFDDWRFDETHDASHVRSYRLDGNAFTLSASLDIASGAGYSGPVNKRVVTHNTFQNADFWPSISFNGSDTGVPWFVYSVGGAVIKDNKFVNTFTGSYPGDDDPYYLVSSGHIRARGTYDNDQFNWTQYWNNNKFNEAYVSGVKPPHDVATYSYEGSFGTINDVRRIGVLAAGEAVTAPGAKTIYKHD